MVEIIYSCRQLKKYGYCWTTVSEWNDGYYRDQGHRIWGHPTIVATVLILPLLSSEDEVMMKATLSCRPRLSGGEQKIHLCFEGILFPGGSQHPYIARVPEQKSRMTTTIGGLDPAMTAIPVIGLEGEKSFNYANITINRVLSWCQHRTYDVHDVQLGWSMAQKECLGKPGAQKSIRGNCASKKELEKKRNSG